MKMAEPLADLEQCVEDLATTKGWQRSYPILTEAGSGALEHVLKGIHHPDWRVRMWCADFLDHFADQRCTAALVAALKDPVADVRRHAMHSLGCQSCKAEALKVDVVPLLIEMALNDSSIRVRRAAAHMLGNQDSDPRTISALSAMIDREDDAKLKSNAHWAIQRASRPTSN